jgi:3-isopropylmalate dehydrogenase
MDRTIAVLPGDGIGEEVMCEALRVLDLVGELFGHTFTYRRGYVGGAAYDRFQSHLPEDTIALAGSCDAILFGSVGGPLDEAHLPKWRDCETRSILALRKAFGFNANLRPIVVSPELASLSPLKREIIGDGIDILIIRELCGDLYFGEHRTFTEGGVRKAIDTAIYDEHQIRSIMHTAFRAARHRRNRVCSVHKANVLDTSKLWRTVTAEVASEYPDVVVEEMLVDNCAMQIVRAPGQFDVIVTSNMFGDILSDVGAVLPGSLGLTPSASLNAEQFGLYEPSGGSAPDIAGKGIANPLAQIFSTAMMLKYSFGLGAEASAIYNAARSLLSDGIRTRDLMDPGRRSYSTREFTDALLDRIRLGARPSHG